MMRHPNFMTFPDSWGCTYPPVAHHALSKISKIFEVYTLLLSGVQMHPMYSSEAILNFIVCFILFYFICCISMIYLINLSILKMY